jgi:hypothetical protein
MGKHTLKELRARMRTVGASASEDEALGRLWGVESCERCGRTIVLGERLMRLAVGGRRAVLCAECVEPAPAAPTWIAAPVRLSPIPVRLTGSALEESQAA